MTSTDHDMREAWARIDGWLCANVRTTAIIRPAADARRLAAIETELPVTLTADVKEWWTLADVKADYWIPESFAPVTLEEALETQEIWLLVAEQEQSLLDQQGNEQPRFLPQFMPIAMSPGGDGLIVDLRTGEHHGAVFLWDHERWGLGVPLWDSVSSMLQDIAGSLESQTPALLRHAALGGTEAACVGTVDDMGDLRWRPR
ncbi:SMI1/KNR4 family protein [Kitasatospora sp. NPDC002965]|uniref:SMI1/KNR4 family protein n=1 Tax=Kitasatospora sp. NPDC002965 TaxID=3154775 RepID=UPI0033B0A7B2